MSKKSAEAIQPAEAPASKALPEITINLTRSIDDDAGQTWTEIKVGEPTLEHFMNAEREATVGGVSEAMRMFAEVTGVPEAAIGKMKTLDAKALRRAIDSFEKQASKVDASVDGDRHTFALDMPIDIPGQPAIRNISLREPDLAVGLIVEKMPKPRARFAAMVASLSGLTIPVVKRLKARDIARIEAWLAPFVDDAASTREDGDEL